MNSSVANEDSSDTRSGADNEPVTKLSCPFTWDMESILEDDKKSLLESQDCIELLADYEDEFPEYLLIYHLMLAYENAMRNDPSIGMQDITNAEANFAGIKQKNTRKNVENVLQHILMGTKYYVHKKLGQLTEADELLGRIYNIDYTCNTELGMLEGCQCMAWSLYNSTHISEATTCIKKALKCDPGNAKWHYLLGTCYRRFRRKYVSILEKPSPEEASAFRTAYNISKNPLFSVSLAQMYRESGKFNDANRIYEEVYTQNPSSCKVRLQIALGFIRAKKDVLAKECLDYVGQRMPNCRMYVHYMGLYEEECKKDSKAALPYYKKATEGSCYVAEWQFLRCMQAVHPEWNPLPYMVDLLEKYKKNTDYVIQQINIEVGLYYLLRLEDIPSACQYLTKAIEIQPDARVLKKYKSLFHEGELNTYHILKNKLRRTLQKKAGEYDQNTISMLQDTLKRCDKN